MSPRQPPSCPAPSTVLPLLTIPVIHLYPSLSHTSAHHVNTQFAKMATVTAQIHIDTSSATSKTLPASPIPLTNATSNTLTPSTQLCLPINSSTASSKSQQLSHLADALDVTRISLNQVLTAWKDWAGKEDAASKGNGADEENDEEQDEDEEE